MGRRRVGLGWLCKSETVWGGRVGAFGMVCFCVTGYRPGGRSMAAFKPMAAHLNCGRKRDDSGGVVPVADPHALGALCRVASICTDDSDAKQIGSH